jgi:inosine-uridine nucleoside N-ribohydrolase
VTLITNYILLAMIPLGLYLAAQRGLWGNQASQKRYVGVVVLPALVAIFAAGIWWRGSQAATIDLSALDVSHPIPVVLDADMAMDDIGALFYLAQHPGVDLRAITVNGVAFAHCEGGVRNALGLLEVAGAPEIPVSCGREEAYPGGIPAPADWRKSADNLYGAQVRTGGREADERPAAELLADTIQAAPGEILVVAIGPLTNLAEAFQVDPTLASQIKEIIIMGGAVDAPGNVADGDPANRVAEWNFIADPVAADIVLASGAPITLVPLDATNDVPFTRSFYERLRSGALTRSAVFTYNLMYMNQWWLDGGMYWWDTLAATLVTDPELVTVEEMALDVITDEGPEMGRTVETPDGTLMRVATTADRQAFEALFLAVLNHE